MFKKITAISLLLFFLFLGISCTSNIEINNKEKNTQIKTENNKTSNINLKYGTYTVVNDNLIKIYLENDESDFINSLDFIDLESLKPIKNVNIKKLNISIESNILVLKNNIVFIDDEIYVFTLTGDFLKTIPLPKERSDESHVSISNDLTKIAFINEYEKNGETFSALKIFDINKNESTLIEELNYAPKDKPCSFSDFSFSDDDKFLLYSGLRCDGSKESEECFGKIDLNNNKITMFSSKNHIATIKNNIICSFDYSASYGNSSSGKITIYNTNSNKKEKIKLKSPNESQFVRLTNDENYFCTAQPNEKNHTVKFSVYKNGKHYKTKTVSFEKESFEATTTSQWNFSFVPEKNKLIYELKTFEKNNPNDWGTRELKIINL